MKKVLGYGRRALTSKDQPFDPLETPNIMKNTPATDHKS
jgi:hypothetical protein